MSLVIDASVALKWFVPEPGHEAALAILDGNDAEQQLLAPDWLLVEVANALWKQWRRKAIEPDEIEAILVMLPDALTLLNARPLVPRASAIAQAIDHPVYDCLYLAAAEAHAATLVTDDRALIEKAATADFRIHALRNPAA